LSYTLEVNRFTAMTQEEFTRQTWSASSTSSAFASEVNTLEDDKQNMRNNSLGGFPSDLNWVKRGAVNSPINQGSCGSCYASETLGTIEAACWQKTGVLPKLSVQGIVDCSWEQGNEGCKGGQRSNTLAYIEDYGIAYSDYYPYEAKEQMCKKILNNTKLCLKRGDITINDVIEIERFDLDGLFAQLQEGPIVIAIDDKHREWQLYKGGILDFSPCNKIISHMVLLVGYGVENGKSYWTIRNTYGTGWGEGGYARIIRDPKAKKGP
ncbi:hypothetical protein FOL47_000704, partial [Perkinsus chesapeaki]